MTKHHSCLHNVNLSDCVYVLLVSTHCGVCAQVSSVPWKFNTSVVLLVWGTWTRKELQGVGVRSRQSEREDEGEDSAGIKAKREHIAQKCQAR